MQQAKQRIPKGQRYQLESECASSVVTSREDADNTHVSLFVVMDTIFSDLLQLRKGCVGISTLLY